MATYHREYFSHAQRLERHCYPRYAKNTDSFLAAVQIKAIFDWMELGV